MQSSVVIIYLKHEKKLTKLIHATKRYDCFLFFKKTVVK